MPIPKVRTGRLAPDQEALDYYNVPAKHWTQTDWDQIDMSRLDLGLHTDPTPTGAQAADRRYAVSDGWFPGKKGGLGDDVTKDLRIHVGNEFSVFDDPGTWDKPDDARMALSEAAYQAGEPDLQAALDAVQTGNGSTLITSGTAREQVLKEMNELRNVMKEHGYDTISYKNAEEGVDAAVDAALNNPEALAAEVAELDRARSLRDQAVRAEQDGDYELSEQLDMEATDIEDGLEMAREEVRQQAEDGNVSYISLDPGNVRDANAAFKKENIGKADMMGNATVPMLAGSATLGALGTLAANGSAADLGAGLLDTANRFGETLTNDLLTGSQMLSNAIYGTDSTAPQVDFAPSTEAGDTLTGGLMNDFGRLLDFGGYFNGPSAMDLIDKGIGAYKEYVQPHLSERQEQGLGGLGLSAATLLGTPINRTAGHLKRVGDVDSVNNMQYRLDDPNALIPEQKVNPEDLIGRAYVSNMADNSAGDLQRITQIDDVDVDVERQGGFDFMRQRKNVEDGRVWGSEKGAVTGIMNAGREALALPGARKDVPPLIMPWGMSPSGSSDFAQFSADLGVQHALGKLDPRLIAEIDQRIREGSFDASGKPGTGVLTGVPEWAGLQAATPEYLTDLGGKRKNVIAALDEYRGEGALNTSQIRHAVGDDVATLEYRPAGLRTIGELDLERGVMSGNHDTYSSGGAGRYLGTLNPGASILDDPAARLRSGINLMEKYGQAGAKLPSPQGKAMQSNVIGVLDEATIEEWIRRGVFD